MSGFRPAGGWPDEFADGAFSATALRQLGAQLGEALDAGALPVTVAPPPSRLIDVLQARRPIVAWMPRRLGAYLPRILRGG